MVDRPPRTPRQRYGAKRNRSAVAFRRDFFFLLVFIRMSSKSGGIWGVGRGGWTGGSCGLKVRLPPPQGVRCGFPRHTMGLRKAYLPELSCVFRDFVEFSRVFPSFGASRRLPRPQFLELSRLFSRRLRFFLELSRVFRIVSPKN